MIHHLLSKTSHTDCHAQKLLLLQIWPVSINASFPITRLKVHAVKEISVIVLQQSGFRHGDYVQSLEVH